MKGGIHILELSKQELISISGGATIQGVIISPLYALLVRTYNLLKKYF